MPYNCNCIAIAGRVEIGIFVHIISITLEIINFAEFTAKLVLVKRPCKPFNCTL